MSKNFTFKHHNMHKNSKIASTRNNLTWHFTKSEIKYEYDKKRAWQQKKKKIEKHFLKFLVRSVALNGHKNSGRTLKKEF